MFLKEQVSVGRPKITRSRPVLVPKVWNWSRPRPIPSWGWPRTRTVPGRLVPSYGPLERISKWKYHQHTVLLMIHAIFTLFLIRLGFVSRLTTLSYLSSMNPFEWENKYRSYVPWIGLYNCQIEMGRFKKTVQKRSNLVVGETFTCEMIFPSLNLTNWSEISVTARW